ncbi:hypothetical protein H4R24_003931 [Coemansia sp. RSA 988]|nr:hypothetical protein H4R24_003931 [Coemansia sp. RSA 988]
MEAQHLTDFQNYPETLSRPLCIARVTISDQEPVDYEFEPNGDVCDAAERAIIESGNYHGKVLMGSLDDKNGVSPCFEDNEGNQVNLYIADGKPFAVYSLDITIKLPDKTEEKMVGTVELALVRQIITYSDMGIPAENNENPEFIY